jgi:DeoR/GlpR family transcriptional regulator of sugar metabolism
MNRRERIEMVRRLLWSNRQMPLTEIAKVSGVSLRTTYRDLHSLLSRPAPATGSSVFAKQ